MNNFKFNNKYYSGIVTIVFLCVWQGVTAIKLVSPLLLSSPVEIVVWIVQNVLNLALWQDIAMTIQRVFLSFVISVIIGVPIGMLMGYFVNIEKALRLPVDFSRSIPATALFPMFIVFFGSGEGPRIAAAIYGASLIILMNSMAGVKQANLMRIKTAKAYGATGYKLFRYVLLPESMPSIITGFRLGVSLAFVIIVLVEMFIGTSAGLGHRIINAQMLYEIPQMYGTIFITGILGFLLNMLFAAIESKVVHYVGQ